MYWVKKRLCKSLGPFAQESCNWLSFPPKFRHAQGSTAPGTSAQTTCVPSRAGCAEWHLQRSRTMDVCPCGRLCLMHCFSLTTTSWEGFQHSFVNGVFLHWEARQWTFLLAGNKEALRPAVITGSLGPSLNVSWSLVMSRDLVEGLSMEPNQCRPESEPLKPSHPREPILLGFGGSGPWF